MRGVSSSATGYLLEVFPVYMLEVLIFTDGAEGEVVQCLLVAAEENLPFQYPTADVKRE